jgi:pseudouridine kinase
MDVKAHIRGDATLGTSNPARVFRTPGGVACNVARNLGRLGLTAAIFSIVGDDPSARTLLGSLHQAGVDTTGMLRSADPPTASYLAVLDREGRLVVAAADMEIYEDLDPAWAATVAPHLREYDVVVFDANIPAASLAVLLPGAGDALVVADPVSVAKATRLAPFLGRISVLFPNRAEAVLLAGFADGDVSAAAAATRLRELGVNSVVVSLGGSGAYVDDGIRREHVAPAPVGRVVDVTGAGDAQIAGFLYGLALEEEHAAPIDWAMALAGLTLETIDSARADLTPELLWRRLSARPG